MVEGKIDQPVRAPISQQDSQCSSHQRQRDAFGQQLAHQPCACRAQSQPYRDLLLPRRRARQQQPRNVRAANRAARSPPRSSARYSIVEMRPRSPVKPVCAGSSLMAG